MKSNHAAELGAGEVGAGEVGVAEVGTGEVGVGEVGVGEVGVGEPSAGLDRVALDFHSLNLVGVTKPSGAPETWRVQHWPSRSSIDSRCQRMFGFQALGILPFIRERDSAAASSSS